MTLLQATAANQLFPLAGTNTSKNNKSGNRTMDPFVLINCLRVAPLDPLAGVIFVCARVNAANGQQNRGLREARSAQYVAGANVIRLE